MSTGPKKKKDKCSKCKGTGLYSYKVTTRNEYYGMLHTIDCPYCKDRR